MASAIHILSSSSLMDARLQELVRIVHMVFQVPTYATVTPLNLDRALDRSRGQHNSTALLAQLLAMFPHTDEKKIAIVDVDLFIPVLTFVFGEAQLNGLAAVVSTHRLSNQFYGLQRDDGRMFERLVKEAVHELGHTFGLYHCRNFECVMRASTYVEEIDLKRKELCEQCRFLIEPPR